MENEKISVKISNRWRTHSILLILCIGLFLPSLSSPALAQENHWDALGVLRLQAVSPPDFTLNSLDGKPITLGDLKGKVVLLNFWTTWCRACEEEMPSLENLYRKLRDKGFTILAVDMKERPETVRKFVLKYKLTFPVLLDSQGDVARKYLVYAIPSSYIVNKEGKAVGMILGARKWDGLSANALFDDLLGE